MYIIYIYIFIESKLPMRAKVSFRRFRKQQCLLTKILKMILNVVKDGKCNNFNENIVNVISF